MSFQYFSYSICFFIIRVKLTSALNPTQTMRIRVVDGGGRSKIADFTVNIRQDAAPPVFTRVPPDDFKILENLTDDTIIYRIKVRPHLSVNIFYPV